jgi:DegV family protein with EDD domain
MIKIIVDSGTDVPKEVVEKYSISVVPLRVFLDDKEYRDAVDITEDELLKFMENGGIPKTSQPTYDDVKDAFDEAIKEGYDQIIAINISSGLSGTYNVFKLAQSRIEEDNPNITIEVIDSLSISVSSGLLAYKAAKMIEAGNDFDSIVDTLKNIVKSKLRVYYTIPTLKYLKLKEKSGIRLNMYTTNIMMRWKKK